MTDPSRDAMIDDSRDLATSYEALRLHGIVRNWSALAALVLAYSMNWMDLFGAVPGESRVPAMDVSMSAAIGGRQSVVIKPGDMEVWGIPLPMCFVALLAAAILRVAYPQRHRLHPLVPLTLAAPGTLLLGYAFWQALRDGTAEFFTAGFYVAFAAFTLNTLFDLVEFFDWRALRKSVSARSDL